MDAVVAIAVFHYDTWTDAKMYVAEAARVLKAGGQLALVVRSTRDNEEQRRVIHDDRQDANTGYTAVDLFDDAGHPETFGQEKIMRYYFAEAELKQLAEENGFEMVGNIVEQDRDIRAERKQEPKIDEGGHVRKIWTYRVMLRKKSGE